MTALRRPAAAGVLVGLFVLVAWWQLLWNPQASALADAHNADQVASTGLIDAGQTLGHLKHLQTISPQLVALEQQLSNAVPTGSSLDTFLVSVNAMAQSAGVDLDSVSPATPTTLSGGLSQIHVDLSLSGQYFNVQRFLDELKTGGRLVVIDTLTEAPGGVGSSDGSLSVTIRAHILSGLSSPPAVTGLAPPPSPAGGH